MNLSQSAPHDPAYWTEWDEHGERLIIRIRRGWKAVRDSVIGFAFLALTLLGLTWLEGHFEWGVETFKLAVAAVIFVPSLLVNLFAREVVMIDRSDLIHRWEIAGFGRSHRFKVHEIRNMGVNQAYTPAESGVFVNPLKDFGKLGAVRFDTGVRTVYLGASLDQAEAQQVAWWLARRLPRGAQEL